MSGWSFVSNWSDSVHAPLTLSCLLESVPLSGGAGGAEEVTQTVRCQNIGAAGGVLAWETGETPGWDNITIILCCSHSLLTALQ